MSNSKNIARRFPLKIAGWVGLCLLQNPLAAQTPASLQGQDVWQAESHISSSNTGADVFSGIDINAFVGADRFYAAGYTGTRTILGNIEAGHADSGHDVLGHVNVGVTGDGATTAVDQHATLVTHSLAGRAPGGAAYPGNYFAYGIAFDANTFTGAIATAFGSGGSFSTTNASTASTYSQMLETGFGAANQTVDVFNSSWGFNTPSGASVTTIGVDGMINDTGVVAVFSAGNSGPGTNTVGGIGAGHNSITVGATGTDTNNYDTIAGFSSRSPNDYFLFSAPTSGSVQTGARAAVDIVAPGTALTLAASGTTSSYFTGVAGTSFSAPIVAGGAALMVDAAKDIYGTSQAIDGRVIKANLLNAAGKLTGWDNGQSDVGGVIQTTQALDYTYGAGSMDLDQTFDQFINQANGGLAGTTDVAGTSTGNQGMVNNVGWDFGLVGNNAGVNDDNFYFIDQMLRAGSDLNVTLSWFADMDSGNTSGVDADFSGFGAEHFANLDLRVFQFDNLTDLNIIGTVAESISQFNAVEHLSFQLAATGFYGIGVNYAGANFNFTGETGETYGLAWFGTAVPEPSAAVFLLLLVSGAVSQRPRRKKRLI